MKFWCKYFLLLRIQTFFLNLALFGKKSQRSFDSIFTEAFKSFYRGFRYKQIRLGLWGRLPYSQSNSTLSRKQSRLTEGWTFSYSIHSNSNSRFPPVTLHLTKKTYITNVYEHFYSGLLPLFLAHSWAAPLATLSLRFSKSLCMCCFLCLELLSPRYLDGYSIPFRTLNGTLLNSPFLTIYIKQQLP